MDSATHQPHLDPLDARQRRRRGLAGAALTQKLGRATLQLGLGIAIIGLLALWLTIVRRSDSLTSWKLAPSLLLIGFGTGLVFVPIFDFILGNATTEEVGTGSGMFNAVQQSSGAIGVAALGTVFFARVDPAETQTLTTPDARNRDCRRAVHGHFHSGVAPTEARPASRRLIAKER